MPKSKNINKELTLYNSYPVPPITVEPHVWWSKNGKAIPLLAELAGKYMAIPAMAADPETLFTYAGMKKEECMKELDSEDLPYLYALHRSFAGKQSNPRFQASEVHTNGAVQVVECLGNSVREFIL